MQIERYCARELQLAFAFTLQVAAFRSDYYPPPRARRVLSYPSCTKRICIKASFSTPSSIYALNPRKTYPHELRESRVRIVDRFSKLEKMWYTTQRRTNERKSYEKCDCALVTVVKKRDALWNMLEQNCFRMVSRLSVTSMLMEASGSGNKGIAYR